MDHFLMTCIFITLWITVICFPGYTTTDCPATVHRDIKGFGPGCRYRCNCQNNVQCEEATGNCPTGCLHGWMGPGCQYRDYAKIPTNSVSQNYNTGQESDYAINAIDGDVNTCSRTGSTGQSGQPTQQWWRVEFTSQLYIVGLVIRIQESQKEKFRGFSVEIGNGTGDFDLCYENGTDVNGETAMNVDCVKPIVGNVLEIKLAETEQLPLVLCEVEIFGGRLVSFNRQTSIESVLDWQGLWNSSYAVDGRPTLSPDENQNMQTSRTCTATQAEKSNTLKWWEVDLGNVYSIQGIRFFSRRDHTDTGQFKSYSVLVCESQTELFKDNAQGDVNSYQPKSAYLRNPVPGRVVRVQRTGSILIICEFEVLGECPFGTCGLECTETCMCISQTTGIHKMEGTCPYGCSGRWSGRHRKCNIECTDTEWGPYCNNTCGHCKDKSSCSVTDGTCPDICEPGWSPPLCIVCKNGTYGYKCSETCGHCFGSVACDHITGHCAQSCKEGYTGSLCKNACHNGTYSERCGKSCGYCLAGTPCDHISGVCENGCMAGYQGNICKTTCNRGTYGNRCSESCGYCLTGAPCNHVTGKCVDGCVLGYQGQLCKSRCASNHWGPNCESVCGHCENDTRCSIYTGNCPGTCKPGWIPPFCIYAEPQVDGNSFPIGVIIGPTVAIVVTGVAVVIILLIFIKRRKTDKTSNSSSSNAALDTQEYDTLESNQANMKQESQYTELNLMRMNP